MLTPYPERLITPCFSYNYLAVNVHLCYDTRPLLVGLLNCLASLSRFQDRLGGFP